MEKALTSDWQFSGAGGAAGWSVDGLDGPPLVIKHPTYAEGSRWEQTLSGLSPGLLLTLKGTAQTEGSCWKNIGENLYSAGTSLSLEALAQVPEIGLKSLEAVESAFFPQANPDGTLQEDVPMNRVLRLIVPDGQT